MDLILLEQRTEDTMRSSTGYNPTKTKDRLERALDRLCDDGVIRSWQYQEADETIIGQKGWAAHWLNWCIIVEPAGVVMQQYDKIKLPTAKIEKIVETDKINALAEATLLTLIERMKQRRLELGLTQLQLAEQLGNIAPNYLATIERGIRRPSPALAAAIAGWLER